LKNDRVGVHSGVLRLAFEKECEACHLSTRRSSWGVREWISGQPRRGDLRRICPALMSGLGGGAHRRALHGGHGGAAPWTEEIATTRAHIDAKESCDF
jgi:hypothetical protein